MNMTIVFKFSWYTDAIFLGCDVNFHPFVFTSRAGQSRFGHQPWLIFLTKLFRPTTISLTCHVVLKVRSTMIFYAQANIDRKYYNVTHIYWPSQPYVLYHIVLISKIRAWFTSIVWLLIYFVQKFQHTFCCN